MQYKSKLEEKFAKQYGLEYEPDRIPYVVQHQYTPDWKLADNIYLETKGRWLSADRTKLKAVLAQNPSITVVMVFQNPNNKLNKNSNTTYADWCEKNGVEWFKYGTQELTDYISKYGR